MQSCILVSQFVDGITVFLKVTYIKRGTKAIEKAIKIIKDNLFDLGLNLSPCKTVLLHFNNKIIVPGSTAIKIGDHSIKSSASVRFLGIIFDYKMSFISQVDRIIKKCSFSLNIIKFLRGTWWGFDPVTLISLYKSFIRSILEHGSFIYFPKRQSMSDKLEKLQFSAIRLAVGHRRSTPTNIMLVESKLLLLTERAMFLCSCFLAKVCSNNNSLCLNAIKCYFNIVKNKSIFANEILNKCI